MAGLTWMLLLQAAAIIYLIYRVHRLEQRVSQGVRPVKRGSAGDGHRKVIPLLREQGGPDSPKGRSTPPPSEPRK